MRRTGLVALILLSACRQKPAPPPPAPASEASDAAIAAISAVSAPGYRTIGRFGGGRFAWSGSTIAATFTGTSLTIRLRSEGPAERIPFTVRVDDQAPVVVDVTRGQERYQLARDLAPGVTHTIRVVREAEAFAGVTEVLGLETAPGGAFLPDKPASSRLEIVGDSITCGYGVIGEPPCHFSFDTERATEAYGARLGRALGADVTTVAWSGKGAYRNYDGSLTETMPALYELAIPPIDGGRRAGTSPWAFAAAPHPDAVILALGTNDFLGGGGRPLDEPAFEDAFVALARRVRAVHPAAAVLVVTSPMLHPGPVATAARTRLEHVVSRRTAEGDGRIELVVLPAEAPHWGCDGHPDRALNARVAETLLPRLRSALRL